MTKLKSAFSPLSNNSEKEPRNLRPGRAWRGRIFKILFRLLSRPPLGPLRGAGLSQRLRIHRRSFPVECRGKTVHLTPHHVTNQPHCVSLCLCLSEESILHYVE